MMHNVFSPFMNDGKINIKKNGKLKIDYNNKLKLMVYITVNLLLNLLFDAPLLILVHIFMA